MVIILSHRRPRCVTFVFTKRTSSTPKSLVVAVVKPANNYMGGVFWRVGVVDLVVLACVLRATTKKRSSTFCLAPPQYFPIEFLLTVTVSSNFFLVGLSLCGNRTFCHLRYR